MNFLNEEVYEENLDSHRYGVGKSSILIAFSDNYFFNTTPELDK